jgi:hypothetical protein
MAASGKGGYPASNDSEGPFGRPSSDEEATNRATDDRARRRRSGRLGCEGIGPMVDEEPGLRNVHRGRRRARLAGGPSRRTVRPSPVRGVCPAGTRGHRDRLRDGQNGPADGPNGEGGGELPRAREEGSLGSDGEIRRPGWQHLLASRGPHRDGSCDVAFASPERSPPCPKGTNEGASPVGVRDIPPGLAPTTGGVFPAHATRVYLWPAQVRRPNEPLYRAPGVPVGAPLRIDPEG